MRLLLLLLLLLLLTEKTEIVVVFRREIGASEDLDCNKMKR